VQSVIGVLAGIAVFGRRFLFSLGQKIKSLFSRSAPDKSIDKP